MSLNTVYLLSLGCAKNQVDSEIMAGVLRKNHYRLTDNPAQAEIIIVNTCGFIEAARQEAIEALLDLAAYKSQGRCRLLVAVGCMIEKFGAELAEAMPELDVCVGVGQYDKIAALLSQYSGRQAMSLPGDSYLQREVTLDGGSAYLKIAEGCDNRCSYCLIPQLRGPYVSRPLEDVVAEAKALCGQGVSELVLIAQDSTRYGLDLAGRSLLPELLEQVAQLPFSMVRLLYVYPDLISPELLAVMKKYPNICHYLDMPIQHCSGRVLKAMHRRGDRDSLLSKVRELRAALPDLVLRTTVMVGFPGESEEDFEQLLDFLAEARFDWLGAFPYYQEPDTEAATLPDQVEEEVKQQRLDQVMEQAAALTEQALERYVGQVLTVLACPPDEDTEPGWSVGRSQYQAPDVDGLIYFTKEGAPAQPGQLYRVRITGHDIYDLYGEDVEE